MSRPIAAEELFRGSRFFAFPQMRYIQLDYLSLIFHFMNRNLPHQADCFSAAANGSLTMCDLESPSMDVCNRYLRKFSRVGT